jgi:hypothetical protein
LNGMRVRRLMRRVSLSRMRRLMGGMVAGT